MVTKLEKKIKIYFKSSFFFLIDITAKIKIERDINEARRNLERIEHTYTEVIASQVTLEKEIATYRELLESKYFQYHFNYSTICLQVQLVFEDVLIE